MHYGDVLIRYPSILNIKREEVPYITDGTLEKYKSNLLENGDLIFADAAEDETVGKAVEVNGLTSENLVSGLHTIVARAKEQKAEFFLGYYINSDIYHQQLLRLMQGSKVSSISKGNLQKTDVSFPKAIEEQQKIGTFFKQLDDTIALHQRKLALLKALKRGFLQQLFPKSGEMVPAVRFADFDGDWEQRKLGDESDVRDGTHDSPKYYDNGHPLVTSKNLKDFGLDLSNVSLISDEDFEVINKRSKVDIGDILFGMIGTIGNPVQVDRDDFAIKNVALIKEQKKILNSFLIQVLKSPVFDKYIKNENAGGTQKFLALSKVRGFDFLCPNIEEQNCISTFFRQLDNSITLQQQKTDNLISLKKAYLQKMFV